MSRIMRPSPALVVAILALVAAVAVPAFALTKAEKRVIKKIANAQISKRAPGLAAVGRTNFEPLVCTDQNHTGEDCTSVALTLPRRARVLVVASATYFTALLDDPIGPGSNDDPSHVNGSCRITIDGIAIGATARSLSRDQSAQGGVALNRVTFPLDPDTHTFALRCEEADGDINWTEPSISAVMLGSG